MPPIAALDGPLLIRQGSIVLSTLALLIFIVGLVSWLRARAGAGDDGEDTEVPTS